MILKAVSAPFARRRPDRLRNLRSGFADLAGRPRGGDFPWRRAGAVAPVGAPLGRRRHIGAFPDLCRSGWPVSPDIQHYFHDGVRHARSGAGREPPAASASRRGDRNFAAGGRPLRSRLSYSANEVSALRWVHATLVETALLTHDLVLPALTNSEREQYWAEAKLYAALFGLRQADLPSDWTSFTAYTEAMARSDSLAVSPAARNIAEQIFSGSRDRIARAEMVSGADGPFVAGAVGPENSDLSSANANSAARTGAGVDPARLSPASHAPARSGPLSGGAGALARRSSSRTWPCAGSTGFGSAGR